MTMYSRYLISLFCGTIGLLCVCVFFVFAVDPYGVRPTDTVTAGWNSQKLEDPWRDGRAMRTAILVQQPRTLILGSSRVVLSMDETLLRDTRYWPAYNAGTYNSDLGHRLSMLKLAAKLDTQLEEVLFEVSPLDLIHSTSFWQLPPVDSSLREVAGDAASLFFSEASIARAIRVLYQNFSTPVGAENRPVRLAPFGTHQIGLKTFLYAAHTFYGMFPPAAEYNRHWKEPLAEIFEICEQLKITCRPILTPMSAPVLHAYHKLGLWPQVREMMIEVAKRGKTINLLHVNRLTAEPEHTVSSAWIDSIHFNSAYGDVILNALATGQMVNENVGTIANILRSEDDAIVAADKLEKSLVDWVNTRPDISWSFEQLRRNIVSPPGAAMLHSRSEIATISLAQKTWTVSETSDTGGDFLGHMHHATGKSGDITGFAADAVGDRAAEIVVIFYDGVFVASMFPWFQIPDDRGMSVDASRSGFHLRYTMPVDAQRGGSLRAFSLFEDGTALEIGLGGGIPLS